jgi:transposase
MALSDNNSGWYAGKIIKRLLNKAHEMTLGKWVKVAREAAESGKNPDAPLGESERAGLVRLRAGSRDDKSAIAELRMQAEFAKKVAAWFAKGSQ